MNILSTEQVAALRTHPHTTKFFLAVHKPRVTYEMTVNDLDITQGATSIPYTFVMGDIEGVHAGMTLFVSSGRGLYDKGRVRIKSIDEENLTIVVAENSHIAWAHGDYLEVAELYEPWGINPKVETNEEGDQVQVWQDTDIEYEDQNEKYPPVAIMGPPAIAFIEPAVGCDIYFDGSRSYGLNGATIESYAWYFEETATPETSTEATPGWVHFPYEAAHDFFVHLVVTDSNGKQHHGHRWVRLFDPWDMPIEDFEVTSLSGSYDEGTWRASFVARDPTGQLSPMQFMDGAQIAVFSNNNAQAISFEPNPNYNNAKLPFNPNYSYRDNLLFMGWVIGETIRRDPDTDDVSFEAVGTCGRMELIDQFPDTLEIPTTTEHAENWWQADNLNLDLALYAHLKWRSTILDIVDVYLPQVVHTNWHPGTPWTTPGTTDYKIMRQDFPAGSLYEQCDQLMRAAVGRVLSDRLGSVFCRIDPQVYPDEHRADLPIYMHIEDQDWKGELSIEGRGLNAVSQIDLGGVDYQGGTDPETSAIPVLALAPGTTPRYEGVIEKVDGIIMSGGQTFANRLAGDLLGWRNNPFPLSKVTFSGSYVWCDFAPPMWVTWTLDPDTNKRGVGWTEERFIPRSIEIRLLNDAGHAEVLAELEKEAEGPSGITGIYPPTEPPSGPTGTPQPPTRPTPPVTGKRWRKHVLLATDDGPYYTDSFVANPASIAGTPSWRRLIGGMDFGDYDTLCLAFHPTAPQTTHYCLTANAVYRRRPAVSDDWVRILHISDCVSMGLPASAPAFYTMQTNAKYGDHLYVVAWGGPSYGAVSKPVAMLFKSVDQGVNWTAAVINSGRSYRYSQTSDLQVLSTGECNILYVGLWDSPLGTMLYRSGDFGDSWAPCPPRDTQSRTNYYLSTTSTRLWKHYRAGSEDRIKMTVDAGATWATLGPVTDGWYPQTFGNMPGKHWFNSQLSGLTRVCDGEYMYKSLNFGVNWTRTKIGPAGAHAIDQFDLIPDSPDYLYTWGAEYLGYGANKLGASLNEGVTLVSKQGNIASSVAIRDMTPIWTL